MSLEAPELRRLGFLAQPRDPAANVAPCACFKDDQGEIQTRLEWWRKWLERQPRLGRNCPVTGETKTSEVPEGCVEPIDRVTHVMRLKPAGANTTRSATPTVAALASKGQSAPERRLKELGVPSTSALVDCQHVTT